MQYALVFIPGVITGRLCDLGYFRAPFAIGTFFVLVATFLVGQCTTYWQFLLCQGFFLGVRSRSPSVSLAIRKAGVADHNDEARIRDMLWRDNTNCWALVLQEERVGTGSHCLRFFYGWNGIPYRCSSADTSRGVRVTSISVLVSLSHITTRWIRFPWTMRIMGFMILGTLGFANLTLARRLPPKNMPGGIFNVGVFKSPAFSIYCASAFVCFLGIYTGEFSLLFLPISSLIANRLLATFFSPHSQSSYIYRRCGDADWDIA